MQTIQSILAGIVAGLLSALIVSGFVSLWNINGKTIVRQQSRRIHMLLCSINNDITWGVEDYRDDYYDNLMGKIPFVLHAVDTANCAISRVNFILLNRRKYVIKQLEELKKGLEEMMIAVAANNREAEKLARLDQIRKKYQTSANNELLIRAAFLEQLTFFTSPKKAYEKVQYLEDDAYVLNLLDEV